MKQSTPPPFRLVGSLILLSTVSIALLAVRVLVSDSFRYSFMIWNLFLAAVPVLLSWWLVVRAGRYGWRQWQQVVLLIAWIVFLPNSFYIITDFIHLQQNYEADLLFDITMLTSFVVTGLILGYMSVYMVHQLLLNYMRERWAYGLIGLLFLVCSFAVCLGRYTRWNTWDILLQPAGLLFDVSDRLLNPGFHIQTYQTTITLFLVIFSGYVVVFESIRWLRAR